MAHDITIPRLGWSMEEGVLSKWLKSPGELVLRGEVLFTLEGEKAAEEIESFDSGYLCLPADAPRPGETVKVGQVIGYLIAEGEAAPPSVRTSSPAAPAMPVASVPPSVAREPSSTVVHRVMATPRARRRAMELDIDWKTLTGTGRDGRIRERDIVQPPASSPDKHTVALKRRAIIAQRMVAGMTQAAPVTLTTKVDAGQLLNFRNRMKQTAKAEVPSYSDILIHLVARTLREQPQLNSCWQPGAIYQHDDIHIALAVDTEQGLLAPVIRHADRLDLDEIASQTRLLIEQARSNRLTHPHLEGGTFTITNLGMFGIDSFTPILNLPQAGILGIGRIVEEPVVQSGQIVAGHTLSLSLTFDHRVVDGAPAARWLQSLNQRVVGLDRTQTNTM